MSVSQPNQADTPATPVDPVRTRFTLGELTKARVAWALALVAVVAMAIGQLALVRDFRVDDAYITLSFSKNLAAGNGPIFSNGERVEGYSNFLWMVLNAIGFLVTPNADPYIFARTLGFAAYALLLLFTYRLARLRSSAWSSLIAIALLAANTDLTRAAMSGLETVPFTAAVTYGWYAYLDDPKRERKYGSLAWLPALLFRIDGFVPFLVQIAYDVVAAFARRRLALRKLVRWLAPVCALWALYFAWRWAYYGLPLPTTYYAKSMARVAEPELGYDQIWALARDYGVPTLVPFMVLPVLRGPRFEALGLWAAVSAQLAYVAYVGGDWMPFQRFFLPVVPLGAVLVAWGSERAFRDVASLRPSLRILAQAGVLAMLSFSAVHLHAFHVETREEGGKLGGARHVAKHTHQNLLGSVDLLRYMLREPGDRLVTDYAGVFAVYTDARIIDMWGLCNEDIALHGSIEGINAIYGKACPPCVQRADPDFFHVETPLVREPWSFKNMKAMIDSIFLGAQLDALLDFSQNYVVGRVTESRTQRTLWFLERRRPNRSFATRAPAAGIRVDYPFGH